MFKLFSVVFTLLVWLGPLTVQAGSIPAERTLRVVWGDAPQSFDVLTAELESSSSFLQHLFLPLWRGEGDQWQLLDRWDVSEDGRQYKFYLREGLLWKDGSTVEAEDLVASMTYQLSGEDTLASRSFYSQVMRDLSPETGRYTPRIKASGKYSLDVEMRNPDPVFMDRLGLHPASALQRRQLKDRKAGWDALFHIQTLSPYRVLESNLPTSLVLEKSPDFPGVERLYWERIEFSFIPQFEKRMSAMKQGKFDVAMVMELNNDIGDTDSLPGELILQEEVNSRFIILNPQNKLLQNPVLREVFYLLADPNILTSRESKLEQPLFTLVPAQLDPIHTVSEPVSFSREQRFTRAQQLLDDLGISPDKPVSFRFRVLNNRGNTTPAHRFVEIARRYGLVLDMIVDDSDPHYGGFFEGDYDFMTIEWFPGVPVATEQVVPFGLDSPLHKQGYESPAYLAGMEKFNAALNKKMLYEAVTEIDQAIIADRYVLPVSSFRAGLLLGPRIDASAVTDPKFVWMLKPADQSTE